ncbi:MAG: asparaginase [Calditrichaeota bacterium]|nr:asparaginase [Calditrichota bacterium]
MSHKRTLVLFLGGTIIMEEHEGRLAVPTSDRALKILHDLEPRVDGEFGKPEIIEIANIDSTEIRPEHWDHLTRVIEQRYEDFDGFVITHGTDTMAYTASALSFCLAGIGKPVVLTGSQVPGCRIETDARRNFVNAMRLVREDLAGVYIVFDEEVIPGVRATKVSESRLDAFQTVNASLFGEIRTSIQWNPTLRTPATRRHSKPIHTRPGFSGRVAVLSVTPGMPPEFIRQLRLGGVEGIVLRGYGAGNVPSWLTEELCHCMEARIPIVVATQCVEGRTEMTVYESGRLVDKGAIQAHDMSLECAFTKLSWLLHQHTDASLQHIRAAFEENFVGELDARRWVQSG